MPTIAQDNGLAAPVDLFSLFETHCPIAAGTPGHLPSKAVVPCEWIATGGMDACHPDNTGYDQIARAVLARMVVEGLLHA